MRQIGIGNFDIVYPSEILWLQDNNTIKVTGNSSKIGCRIVITSPDGKTNTLEYYSPINTLLFNIGDNINHLYDESYPSTQWFIDIYLSNGDENWTEQFTFATTVIDGKSFSTKSHGSSSVIYFYGDPVIQIFSPHDGKITINSYTFDIKTGINDIAPSLAGITGPGEYTLDLDNKSTYPPTAYILNTIPITPYSTKIVFDVIEQGVDSIPGGTLWNPEQIFPKHLTLKWEEKCSRDEVIIYYRNTDGCIRYVSGKLIEETDTFSPTKHHGMDTSVYKYAPIYINNSNSKILKIGFENIDPGFEFNDIIYSPWVKIKGIYEDVNCMLKTDSIKNEKNNGFDNFELEIIVSEL